MLKTFVIAGAVIAVGIAGTLVYAAMQPDEFRLARSTAIAAAPETIYPLMSDFRRGMEWSPYEKKDPEMKRRFSGAPTGKGSIYEFEGNSEVGAGRIEIADTSPPNKVVLRLDMIRPFQASNVIEYTILPKGSGSEVTWSMAGRQPFLAKVVCLFFNMDRMVGQDFEKGLASLKAIAEK